MVPVTTDELETVLGNGRLEAVMLGSGTSAGVPVIGCGCEVCTSDDAHNRRLRTSLWLRSGTTSLLIDSSTDLRQQALVFGIERLDAILYTHAHADHILGLDDVRAFNFRQRQAIPCYGSAATLAHIRRCFSYVFEPGSEGGGKPRVDLFPVDGPFAVGDIEAVPVPVEHGSIEALGYRFGSLAYVTDCSGLPPAAIELLAGVEVLILDALRFRSHPTHFSVGEAIEAAAAIGPRRLILTHLSHEVDHRAPREPLPAGVELGYDGLRIEFS